MKKLIIIFGILIFTNCAPKVDIDAYVNESCACFDEIDVENMDKSAFGEEIYNCLNFDNNEKVYQDLITQHLKENPDIDYITAEENAPKVIHTRFMENCPSYKKLFEQQSK